MKLDIVIVFNLMIGAVNEEIEGAEQYKEWARVFKLEAKKHPARVGKKLRLYARILNKMAKDESCHAEQLKMMLGSWPFNV